MFVPSLQQVSSHQTLSTKGHLSEQYHHKSHTYTNADWNDCVVEIRSKHGLHVQQCNISIYSCFMDIFP